MSKDEIDWSSLEESRILAAYDKAIRDEGWWGNVEGEGDWITHPAYFALFRAGWAARASASEQVHGGGGVDGHARSAWSADPGRKPVTAKGMGANAAGIEPCPPPPASELSEEPPLPPAAESFSYGMGVTLHRYTEEQMRAYAETYYRWRCAQETR